MNHPLLHRKNGVYFFFFLAIWILLYVVVTIHVFHQPLSVAFTDSLISNGLLALSVFLISNTLSYYHPVNWQFIFCILGACVFSAVWLLADHYMLVSLDDDNEPLEAFVAQTLWLRFSMAFLVHAGIIFIGLLWYKLVEHQAKQERQEETEKIVREAELFKLRQQLQPHFLFNSLNSISALVKSQPAEARNMIFQLSDFLRGTLKREENQLITLQEELEYLQLYLNIEQVRFGHRMITRLHADEDARNRKIPPMLLQPLMENAIKFGLYGTTGEVIIELQATTTETYLFIEISNPFDTDTHNAGGTGFGLKSVQRRLYLLFARNDLLDTEIRGQHFVVHLKIPYSL